MIKRTIFYASILVNVLLISVVTFLVVHYGLIDKAMERINPEVANASYSPKEVRYLEQTSLYDVYNLEDVKIVMLGDSITERADWEQLLDRNDIVNMGIGRDTTEGMLNRLDYVIDLEPTKVFIMAGINDIYGGVSVDEIFKNYKAIIEKLKENGIQPIIQSTLRVSMKANEYKETNEAVEELNNLLSQYTKNNGIIYMDLNQYLSDGNTLKGKYTFEGVHINGNAYDIWSKQLEQLLNK